MPRGFTLIELLVTLALLGVLVLNLTLILGDGSVSYNNHEELSIKNQREALIKQIILPQREPLRFHNVTAECSQEVTVHAGGYFQTSECRT